MKQRLALFPQTTRLETTTHGDELTIAGLSIAALAQSYGTPLYLYDAATLDHAVAAYRQALQAYYPGQAGITYAGKAYLSLALAQWAAQRGLWIDCTGLGELAVATAAGIPRAQILLHGVNKSARVLAEGIVAAGTIVVDNVTELERIVTLAARFAQPLPTLWLRFRPGRAVATHAHIQTGQEDSKFGMGSDEVLAAAELCRAHDLPLGGLHFHLGSQFRDPAPVAFALERALDLAQALALPEDWALCPGGGLGVAYHEEDLPHPDAAAYTRFVAEAVVAGCRERDLPLPRLQLEPGRSLVARAGVAVYRVGAVKESAGRRWLLLDGGMADNARYALYEARYTALPISQPLRPAAGPASLAGPYCESGDILIEDLPCAAIDAGELVAVPVSGAYHLSMASNYNGATRPVVLWLQGGEATLIQAREEAADLLRRDHPLPGHEAALSAVPLRKYQANGNDYLVMRLGARGRMPTPAEIRRICERRGGIGADGLLVDCSQAESGFALRIFNPDGSEAEKSGNGVAIFARYLWDGGRVDLQPFTVSTGGGPVVAQLQPEDGLVTLQLGRATFAQGPEPRAEPLVIDGRPFNCYVVSLGNPHCVVLCDEVTAATAQRWGPLLENAPRFPQRTNVQFVKVVDRTTLQLEIWERGAGYTLASGSSSAAAAAVAHGLNLCDAALVVHTRGGSVEVRVGPERTITVVIPVRKVWQGHLSQEVAPGRDLSGQRRG